VKKKRERERRKVAALTKREEKEKTRCTRLCRETRVKRGRLPTVKTGGEKKEKKR